MVPRSRDHVGSLVEYGTLMGSKRSNDDSKSLRWDDKYNWLFDLAALVSHGGQRLDPCLLDLGVVEKS